MRQKIQTPSSVKKTRPTVTGTNGVDLPVTLHLPQRECINCVKKNNIIAFYMQPQIISFRFIYVQWEILLHIQCSNILYNLSYLTTVRVYFRFFAVKIRFY